MKIEVTEARIFEWHDSFERPTGYWGWSIVTQGGEKITSLCQKIPLRSALEATIDLSSNLVQMLDPAGEVDLTKPPFRVDVFEVDDDPEEEAGDR